MATVFTTNEIVMAATSNNATIYGSHGDATSSATVPLSTTVTGTSFVREGTIAASTLGTTTSTSVWTNSLSPTSWNKAWLWSSKATWAQFTTTAAGSFNIQLGAKDPFVFSTDNIRIAATTNPIIAATVAQTFNEIRIAPSTAASLQYKLILID